MNITTKFNVGDKVYTLYNGRPVAGTVVNISLLANNQFNYKIAIIDSTVTVDKTEDEIGIPEDDDLNVEHGD